MDTPRNLIPQRDLLQQVRTEREPIKKSFWKLLALEVISVALAAALGYTFADLMRTGGSNVLLVGIAGVFFTVSAMTGLFTFSLTRRFIAVTLEAIAFSAGYAVLGHPQIAYLAGAAVIVFIFGLWGDMAVRSEVENHLKVSFFGISRRKIGRMLTGYLLAGIVLTIPAWSAAPLPIPERQFRALYTSGVRVSQVIVPGARLDATVEDFAESITKKELSSNKDFEALPPDQQDKMVRDGAAAMIAQAQKNLAIDLQPTMPVSDVFYQYLTVMARNWKTSFGNSFVPLWVLVIFIFLRGIGVILVWASAILAAILFEAFIAAGAAAVIGEPATREHVILT